MEVFFDFVNIAALADLNTKPTNSYSSFIGYIFLHPTPAEVFDNIPTLLCDPLLHTDLRTLSFPHKIIGPESFEIVKNAAYPLHNKPSEFRELKLDGESSWFIHHNMEVDFHSCATRVLTLLGCQSILSERYTDPYLAGVLPKVFQEMIFPLLSCAVGYTSRTECTLEEELIHSKDDAISITASALHEDFTVGQLRQKDIIVVQMPGHVTYALSQRVMMVVSQVLESAERYRSLSTTEVVNWFEANYPPVAGRAGGKVFVEGGDLPILVKGSIYREALAYEILAAGPKNSLELITPLALISIGHVVDYGEELELMLFQIRSLLLYGDINMAAKILKTCHSIGRQSFSFPGTPSKGLNSVLRRDWARLVYGLDVVVGRSEKLKLDFFSEMKMRAIDPVVRALPVTLSPLKTVGGSRDNAPLLEEMRGVHMSEKAYEESFSVVTKRVLSDLIRDKTRLESMSRWFYRRFYWAASGGAPGAKVIWENGEKLRLNKRGAMLDIKLGDITKMLRDALTGIKGTPVQWSVEAHKMESGKLRAILNTSVEYYAIQAYVLDLFDSNVKRTGWYSSAHSGATRVANSLKRLTELRHGVGFMWDYADFNINHIFWLMVQIYSAAVETLTKRAPSNRRSRGEIDAITEMGWCLNYISKARYNTYIVNSTTGSVLKTARGLQSGERGTSFINALANKIDTEVTRLTCLELFGDPLILPGSDHQGDDAYELVPNMISASLASAVYNVTGSAGQANKVLTSYGSGSGGSLGEYLRLHYDSSNYNINGYPIRAMMGVLHGEFFQDPLPRPNERLATIGEQQARLERRGCYLPQGLYARIIRRTCSLSYYCEENGILTKKRVVANPRLAELPAIAGGFGVSTTLDERTVSSRGSFPFIPSMRRHGIRAVLIPSGEGKTQLSLQYPAFFTDHDSLVDKNLLATLRSTANISGDWTAVNSYLRSVADMFFRKTADSTFQDSDTREGCILLSWSYDTVPLLPSEVLPTLLSSGTALRANKANRRAITSRLSKDEVASCSYPSFSARNNLLVSKLFSPFSGPVNIDIDVFSSLAGPPPRFQFPKVPSRALIRKAKDSISDFRILALNRIDAISPVEQDIVASAITGGYQKKPLYDSIANYGRALAEWEEQGSFKKVSLTIDRLCPISDIIKAVNSTFTDNLGFLPNPSPYGVLASQFRLDNEDRHPITSNVRHSYGAINQLQSSLGINSATTLNVLLDAQQGHSRLSRLGVLVSRLERNELPGVSIAADSLSESFDLLKSCVAYEKRLRSPAKEKFAKRAFDWFDGACSLVPPFNPGVAADILTLSRDVTLSIIEGMFFSVMDQGGKDDLEVIYQIARLEGDVMLLFLTKLRTIFPGIIYRD
ncbi:RNA-dependent RNA polymerase [Rugonectria rugulosa dsRNA virus 1]|nr:RNA-dependent RNA polymerase [Rugonectria rugulosa dsRNA virus 1]